MWEIAGRGMFSVTDIRGQTLVQHRLYYLTSEPSGQYTIQLGPYAFTGDFRQTIRVFPDRFQRFFVVLIRILGDSTKEPTNRD